MTILKFKVWGDYAHFKKYYTTTSPLTFEFPPPPTLIGIISAIIGLDKNEYLTYFQDASQFKLAIQLNQPVVKVRWTVNLIDTKKNFWLIHNRTQIRTEFLKNPAFTIFFRHEDPMIYDALKNHLQNHTSVYSISLGLSELLANFEFLDEPEFTEIQNQDYIDIDSVVPEERLPDARSIEFENGKEIFQVNFPVQMQPDRVVTRRSAFWFERNAQSMKCKVPVYWQISSGEKIVFI